MKEFMSALEMIREQLQTVPEEGWLQRELLVLEGAFRVLIQTPPPLQVRICTAALQRALELLVFRLGSRADIATRLVAAAAENQQHDLQCYFEPLFESHDWSPFEAWKLPFAYLINTCDWCKKSDERHTAAFGVAVLQSYVDQMMDTVFAAADPIAHDAFHRSANWEIEAETSDDDEQPAELTKLIELRTLRPVDRNLPALAAWLHEWRHVADLLSSVPVALLRPPANLEETVARWKLNAMEPLFPVSCDGLASDW